MESSVPSTSPMFWPFVQCPDGSSPVFWQWIQCSYSVSSILTPDSNVLTDQVQFSDWSSFLTVNPVFWPCLQCSDTWLQCSDWSSPAFWLIQFSDNDSSVLILSPVFWHLTPMFWLLKSSVLTPGYNVLTDQVQCSDTWRQCSDWSSPVFYNQVL